MDKYLVTGIVPFGDPNQINQALRGNSAFDGLHLTIIGSASHREVGESWDSSFGHGGVVEVLHCGSAYPESAILTGRSGTGVPGLTTQSATITVIQHPTVFDYLRDLELPYDLAVNYNLAIAAGRNVVVCEVFSEDVGNVERAFYGLGFRNIRTIASKQPEPVLTGG